VNKNFIITPLANCDADCEIVWCEIQQFKKAKPLIVGSFYRPPDSKEDVLENLDLSLAQVREKNEGCNIILGGDFNLNGIDWQNQSIKPSCPAKGLCEKLLDIINDYGLAQIVDKPTYRGISILDLCFTSTPNLVDKINIAPGISVNDHDLVQFETKFKAAINRKEPRNIFIYRKADHVKIRRDLTDFHRKFCESDPMSRSVDENWAMFKKAINDNMEKHIPQKSLSGRWHQPWINLKLKRQIGRKQRLFRRARKSGKTDHWNEFRSFRNKVNKLIKRSYWNYVNKLLEPKPGAREGTVDKNFYRYVKSQRKETCGVSPLKTDKGLMTGSKEKAEALNQQFEKAFTDQDISHIPDKGESPYADMPKFFIQEGGITALINKLDPNKASGPDQISAHFLILYNSELAPILRIIFQQSLDMSQVPSEWKEANIAPIF
jgi:hypothetical protein